ncbi:MAG: hypothetical protein QXD89_01845 [Candidatus Aenigmatarchaeota archaeon]
MKNVVDILKDKIMGKNKLETIENLVILFLLSFSIVLSISIGASAIWPKGILVIFILISSFFIFVFIIFLVVIWIIREV